MAFPINHANAANGIIALLNNGEILEELYQQLSHAKPKSEITPARLYEEYWHGWLRLRDIYLEHKAESAAERFITSPTTEVLDRAIYRAGELDGSFEQQMYSGEYPDAPWETAVSIAMCLVVCWFRRLENAGNVEDAGQRRGDTVATPTNLNRTDAAQPVLNRLIRLEGK